MLTKNQIKLLRALGSRKHRQKYHKFIAEGEKLVREAIREWPDRVEFVVVDPEACHQMASFHQSDIPCIQVDSKVMDQISGMETPPGVLCLVSAPEDGLDEPELQNWMLYLDGVRDPGNLGTIIRTADWFGMRTVVLGPGCADWMNPKVVQASMGSIFRVTCPEMTVDELLAKHPGYELTVAVMDGEAVGSFRFPDKGIIVMGSESHGISRETIDKARHKVTINKNPDSRAESLNVATAAGILMDRICFRNPLQ